MAATLPPTDLNMPPRRYTLHQLRDNIGPIVAAKCVSCHQPTYTTTVPPDTIRAAAAST